MGPLETTGGACGRSSAHVSLFGERSSRLDAVRYRRHLTARGQEQCAPPSPSRLHRRRDGRRDPRRLRVSAQSRVLAFERHDLVLAKLARNTDRNREDVVALAQGPGAGHGSAPVALPERAPAHAGPAGPRGPDAGAVDRIDCGGQRPSAATVGRGPSPIRRLRRRHQPVAKFVPDTQPNSFVRQPFLTGLNASSERNLTARQG